MHEYVIVHQTGDAAHNVTLSQGRHRAAGTWQIAVNRPGQPAHTEITADYHHATAAYQAHAAEVPAAARPAARPADLDTARAARAALTPAFPDASVQPAPGAPGAVRVAPEGPQPTNPVRRARWRRQLAAIAEHLTAAGWTVTDPQGQTHITATPPAAADAVTYGLTSSPGGKLHILASGTRTRCGLDVYRTHRMERVADDRVCSRCRAAADTDRPGSDARVRAALMQPVRTEGTDHYLPAPARTTARRMVELGFAERTPQGLRLTATGQRTRARLLSR